MQFGNPIVGLEELIREAIRSKNFSSDPETGVSGWRIARDGSATFYNLTVGSEAYFIDEEGNAVFNTVSAEEISLAGTSLTETLARHGHGIINVVTLSGNTAGYTGTDLLFATITIPNFQGDRQYAIGGSAIRFDKQAGVDIDRVNMSCYIAYDREATNADTELFSIQHSVNSTVANDEIISFRHPFHDTTPEGETAHLSLYFYSEDTSGNLRVQAINGSRIYTEDVGPAITYNDYDMSSGVPPTQQYTETYTATFSDSFQEDGTDRNVGECYQGDFSSTNGNQFSLIMFDNAQMRADLAGATIDDVNVYLNNNHSYFNGGMTAVVGTHDKDNIGGDQSYSNVNPDRTRESFSKGQAKWFDVPNSIGEDFRDGQANGLLLGKAPSGSNEYYGYFAGYNQSGPPKIQITYTK